MNTRESTNQNGINQEPNIEPSIGNSISPPTGRVYSFRGDLTHVYNRPHSARQTIYLSHHMDPHAIPLFRRRQNHQQYDAVQKLAEKPLLWTHQRRNKSLLGNQPRSSGNQRNEHALPNRVFLQSRI